ncbi:EAL domain-containing protein [Methylomicrobium sp. RS1]|uniref:EAL domain-containing protein n=1 Tax=Candidatus Methylomicrobium oryzae TaxID=2802053 RepID=UPI0019235DD2|nr:EAL domain-containing protein [Methylomicrobium sp. RS1]MBL1264156.1 EAL domain-containing protein [Methylomicrobium sp. RS1]
MKYKIPLFLAIALVLADIFYALAAHYWQRLDYGLPLLAINGLFGFYTAALHGLAEKRFQSTTKLPLPVATEVSSLQFSDQMLVRHFSDLLCLKDKDGRWLAASDDYLAGLGLEGTDYFGKTDFELAQKADCDVSALKNGAAEDKKCWERGEPTRTLRHSSSELALEETRTPVFDLAQKPFRMVITGRPASEFDKNRTRLEWLERALHGSHIAYAQIDRHFRLLDSNLAFSELTGYPPDELAGKSLALIIGDSAADDSLPSPENSFNLDQAEHGNRSVWTVECRHKQGHRFPARLETTAIRAGENEIRYFAGLTDISEQKRLENQLKLISHHDDLTGLTNRPLFFERLEQFLSTSGRYQLHAVVLYINLDRFKAVNESMGHAAGDELLKQAGKRLSEITRKSDVVARLSGDEFAVLLLNDKDRDRAIYAVSMIAKKIIRYLSEAFHIQSKEIFISVSIGIAIFPEDGTRPETLLKNADTAMKEAKQTGRNNYQFYRKEYTAATEDRLSMEMNLRRAIAKNELQLYYQPQYLAKERQLCGAEVLIRWFQPTLSGEIKMVPPNLFIPVAEESGLIVEIGKWILRTACEQSKSWQDEGIFLPRTAVNISARQFTDPDFLQIVEEALHDSGLAPEYLELEITESTLVGDVKRIELQLKRLKKMGIHIALDDFGTGYSSLSYLKNFPVDILKIDQSFVREMTHDSRDANIARAIIEMGHSLGQQIVAEGVETEDQLRYLANRECDIIQGYFFSPPLPNYKMTDLLRQQKDNIGKMEMKCLIS